MKPSTQREESIELPKAVDLFCGCGGLTAGLKRAKFEVIGAVEIDKNSLETYEANHPEVVTWCDDIKDLKGSTVKRKLGLKKGELDLLAGCPPCQGFSTMRTLNGARSAKDPRNGLIMEFLRFVEEFKPKAVMLENVPGLAGDKRFDEFLGRMRELGYEGDPVILNAMDYGVPQRRRRLIYAAGLNRPAKLARSSKKVRTVRDTIGGLPPAGSSRDAVHNTRENRTPKVLAFIERIPKDGGSRTDLPLEEQLECHKRCNGFKDVYGRMAWDKPAPTITSGCHNPSKGRFLHPEADRAITLREAALLQGFPKSYKFPTRNNKQITSLMIGNALPPEFIKRHAEAIKRSVLAD